MEKESDVMTKPRMKKIEKIMADIRSIIDEIDQEEEYSYYADKMSYAATLLEVLLDEAKTEQKSR
jgi:uncharacterized protein YfcZ (UPF0381/DUF406 family)